MKAVLFSTHGKADVLHFTQTKRPSLTPDSLLVKVAAAGVNPIDWHIRNGEAKVKFPFVCGSDVAGVVEEVGAKVSRFAVGDYVFGLMPVLQGGGYAEYAALKEEHAAHAPASITLAEAAAVPMAALVALQGLRDRAKLQPGCNCMVYGAVGGVGSFAVQIAVAMGAHVIAVASGLNMHIPEQLGAEKVMNYKASSPTALGQICEVVFDAVSAFPADKASQVLTPTGTYVTVNPNGIPLARKITFPFLGRKFRSVEVQPSGADLEYLSHWINDRAVSPLMDKRFPLADAAKAQRYSEGMRAVGKIVLIVDPVLAAAYPPHHG
jgi:NADPH:quinone reductase-like Zn-dependent oxidoreductase